MKLKVEDMTCGGCARAVTAAIREIDENAVVNIDVATRLVEVQSSASNDAVTQALNEAGFPPEVLAG
ncbi:heavy-metal-associated domain-containing protein [Parathalassolituus penaei]|uniref:Heavy-metal-associated domain-containing protein n=1 Tax=Parathalassolituus penaei TaxID=2997323 RepID=A0A9X3EFT5_9GAMM|nr:heavy-metal-associated domain-containing protein [Parathalassolituus penaei]MCY0966719.1 heavy-metal-associated domain-containing protein [Parathalassolituus penaei]